MRKKTIPVGLAIILVLGLVLVFPGCTTTFQTPDKSLYTVNGIEYGVTEGRFRGRWWNYYERGRSFLEGGFYEEARRDFETALAGRRRDELWPRTYGLHFLPEYFPNREIGIVKYYQGDISGSLVDLERSNNDQYSARAAYFLGEARRQWLASEGTDTAIPTIEINEPGLIGATQFTLTGIARDDTFIDTITVAGQPFDVKVSASEVAFSHPVILRPGQNEIEVIATDLLGKAHTITVPIASDVDGPVVSFDRPLVLPGTLSGVAYDPAGIASLTIAGTPATLTEGPDGVVNFAIDLTPEGLQGPITYTSEDTLGNPTTGTLPLDALALTDKVPEVIFASNAPQQQPIHPGIDALLINGQPILLAAAHTDPGGITVDIDNVLDGQEYYRDEIVVAMSIRAANPIDNLTLNGEILPTIPGRSEMRVSRKVRIEQEGEHELLALAIDTQGDSQLISKKVNRALSEIEIPGNKLAIAFMNKNEGTVTPERQSEDDAILFEIENAPPILDRFTIVDRTLLENVLQEQQLSAFMASPENRLSLQSLVSVEVLFATQIRRDAESIEIVLNGTSTETGVKLGRYISVAGPRDDLPTLLENLGVRLAQEFPKVQGMVLDWTSPEVLFEITESQGIKNSFKCLVFESKELKHPATGIVLGSKPLVHGNAIINAVGEAFSTAEVFPLQQGQDVATLPIIAGEHYVVIK